MKSINNKGITERRIKEIFLNLPSVNCDNYTVILKKEVIDNDLMNKKELLINILLSDGNRNVKFACFYSLLISCRQYEDYSSYIKYVEDYGGQFKDIELYNVVKSTYHRNKGILGDKDEMNVAISFAEKACISLPSNLVVKHHFAELITLAIEEDISIDMSLIDTAIEYLQEIISEYPSHAKYVCTRGRLYAARREYQKAISDIKRAIDLEKVNKTDSLIRLGRYNYYLLNVKLISKIDEVDKQMLKVDGAFDEFKKQTQSASSMIKNELDNLKTRYLEYLIFFSSIIAFIITTVNIATRLDDFNKSAGLILMFGGTLSLIFCIFRTLLPYALKDKYCIWRVIITIVISIILVGIGYVVGNNLFNII